MKKGFFTLAFFGAIAPLAMAQTVFNHGSFDEVKALAAKENKMIFIDFFTEWCGPCKMMSNQIFPMEKVGEFMNKHFVNIKLDAEKEGAAQAAEFSVNSYPTFVILDAEGKLIGKFSGGSDADRFLNRLESKMNPDLAPGKVAERYENGDRDPKLVRTYIQQLSENKKNAEAYKILSDYFNELDDASRVNEENFFVFSMMPPSYGDPRLEFLENNSSAFLGSDCAALIKSAYQRELTLYFKGDKLKEDRFSADEYAVLKNKFKKVGLEKDNAPVFEFIDNRVALDNNAFLAYCEDKFDSLDDIAKQTFIKSIPVLFNPQTPEEKTALSSFIRTRLPKMTYNTIAMSAQTLYQLEK